MNFCLKNCGSKHFAKIARSNQRITFSFCWERERDECFEKMTWLSFSVVSEQRNATFRARWIKGETFAFAVSLSTSFFCGIAFHPFSVGVLSCSSRANLMHSTFFSSPFGLRKWLLSKFFLMSLVDERMLPCLLEFPFVTTPPLLKLAAPSPELNSKRHHGKRRRINGARRVIFSFSIPLPVCFTDSSAFLVFRLGFER